jgi:hypothetical protein
VAAGGQKYLELVSGSLHSRKGDFRDRRVDLCIHDGDLARELDRYHCIDYEPMDVFCELVREHANSCLHSLLTP